MMKRIFLTFLFIPFLCHSIQCQELGLSDLLLNIKYSSENHLVTELYLKNDTSKISLLLQKYAKIKASTDGFLVQLQSNLTVKNKPKLFKKINELVVAGTKSGDVTDKELAKYIVRIEEIKSLNKGLLNIKATTKPTFTLKFFDPTSVAALIATATTTGIEIFKGVKERNASRMTALNTILESLKMKSSTELIKEVNKSTNYSR